MGLVIINKTEYVKMTLLYYFTDRTFQPWLDGQKKKCLEITELNQYISSRSFGK